MDDIDAFKAALQKCDSSYIYRKYLLGHDVWYFREKLKLTDHAHRYDDFKILMSQKLGIHINNIAIVGSAKLGFSITPRKEKAFSAFSEESDIDIVVVSSEIFRSSWLAFLELSSKKKIPGYFSITKNIFRKFVSLKEVDSSNEFFLQWQGKMEPCQKDLQIMYSVPNEINYRIYESWEDVERYHLKGLEELKMLLEESP
jgi:plasmid maintenance system killer protein